jgi:hypothetical protein
MASGVIFGLIVMLAGEGHAASLAWSTSSGTVEGYRVYYGTTPTGRSTFVDAGPSTRLDLNTLSLVESTTYQLCVTAYNAAGESPPCTPVNFTPGDFTPRHHRLV